MKVCQQCGGLYATEPGGEMIAGRICECGAHHASEPALFEPRAAIRHLMQLAIRLELHAVVANKAWTSAMQDVMSGYTQGLHRATGELAKLAQVPEEELVRMEAELRREPLQDRLKNTPTSDLPPGFALKI